MPTKLKGTLSPMIKRIDSIMRWERIYILTGRIFVIVTFSAIAGVIAWCFALWRLTG